MLALVGGSAGAQVTGGPGGTLIWSLNITTDQEPPGIVLTVDGSVTPRPTPFGTVTFILDAERNSLAMTAEVFNIDFTGSQTPGIANDNLTAAHIHSGPNGPRPIPPGWTNSVAWGFFNAPYNDLFLDDAGTIPNPNAAAPIPGDCVAFTVGVGGTCSGVWNATEGNGGRTIVSQLANIFAGRAYVNFHTTQNPGGEIRANISAIPEPSTYVLMATGLGVVGMMGWRRRRTA
jgi:hypothetical protein